MTSQETYRYPGSRPFHDTPLDRRLFWGRGEESHDLLHLTLAERLVVIFASSGLGKSSLINAGLLEPLRERDFLPMVVRLNDPRKGPLATVYEDIEETLGRDGIEILTEPGGRLEQEYGLKCQGGSRPPGELSRLCSQKRIPLWLFFSEVELWRGDVLCEPMLVFDQFEELFSLQSPEKREELVVELANLVRQRIISRDGVEEDAEVTAPSLKILLSLREDWLGSLEELVPKIPGILSHRFRLRAMKKEQAREAIEQPAAVASADVSARAFSYAPEAVDAILDFLSRQRQDGEMVVTDEIAPSQLQLVCRHLEELVAEPGHAPVITLEDLGGSPGKVSEVLNGVLEKYYDDQTSKVATGRRRRAVRRLCETGLVINGRRASCDAAVLRSRFGVTARELRRLTDCHLLRAVPRLDSVYYEIAHDTLVRPISTARRKRLQRRHRVWSSALAAALLVVGTLGAWNVRAKLQLEERGQILAEIRDKTSLAAPLDFMLQTLEGFQRADCLAAPGDDSCVAINGILAEAVDAAREIGPPVDASGSGARAVGSPREAFAKPTEGVLKGASLTIVADSNQLRVVYGSEHHPDIRVPYAKLNAIAVDPGGEVIATAAEDGTLRLWQRGDDEPQPLTGPWKADPEEILAVAFDPRHERFLTSGRDSGLRLWDLDGNALCHGAVEDETVSGQRINTIAWSQDGQQIAVGGKDGVVRVWNGAWRHLEGHGKGVRGVAFDPAGERVASVSDDGTLRIWDLGAERQHSRPYFDDNEENQLKAVAWSADGQWIATGGTSKEVRLWRPGSGQKSAGLKIDSWVIGGHDGAVLALAFRPDGKLASGGRDGAVRLWDPATGRQLDPVEGFKRYVTSVAVAADGTLVGGSYGGTVIVVPSELEGSRARSSNPSVERHPVERHRISQHDLTAVALSPDGTLLASGSSDSTLRWRRWDAEEDAEEEAKIGAYKRMVAPIRGPWGEVRALAFDASGEQLASLTADGNFRIWSAAGELRLTFPSGGAEVAALEIAADGRTLISRSADGTPRFWSISDAVPRSDARATACRRLDSLKSGRLDARQRQQVDRVCSGTFEHADGAQGAQSS